jgi:hypothetical protein
VLQGEWRTVGCGPKQGSLPKEGEKRRERKEGKRERKKKEKENKKKEREGKRKEKKGKENVF